MTRTATAQQGDTLDAICWRELGTTEGNVVEDALALNEGLAAAGTVLAEGTVVTLPDPPSAAAATLETVNLWD
ncbi:tail protein X [Novosphingobium sp. KN65.2]|uniref:tail protein X n=1 Tax=Novosphingobium sp. KN65.2 TaxID=1478134 RepID=UPI0005E1D83B|nr:tail protein X [Novosphingobium sp. KN65.2]CDO35834.1 Tail protein X [Novosphingobium sp. KN65.2]